MSPADIHALIEKRRNAPKQWVVVTRYIDGSETRHETELQSQAENWATPQRRNIGRPMLSRETGETVVIESVEIGRIQ